MNRFTLLLASALMFCSSAFAADCLTTTTISAGGTYTITGMSPITASADCFKISGLTALYPSWAEIDCQGKTINLGSHSLFTDSGGSGNTGDIWVHNCITTNTAGSYLPAYSITGGLHELEDQSNTYAGGSIFLTGVKLFQFGMSMSDGYVSMTNCAGSVIIGAAIDESSSSVQWAAGYYLTTSDNVWLQNITVTAKLINGSGTFTGYSNVDDGIVSIGTATGTPTQGPYVDNLTTSYMYDQAFETDKKSSGVFMLNSNTYYPGTGMFGCFHSECGMENSWFYNNQVTSGAQPARLFYFYPNTATRAVNFTNNVFLNNVLHKGVNNLANTSKIGDDMYPFFLYNGNIFGSNNFGDGLSGVGVTFQTGGAVRDFDNNKCDVTATQAGFITCN